MASTGRGRDSLDADTWRRIGAVLDRLSDLDRRMRPDALEAACRAEGLRMEDVRPYLEADQESGEFPRLLDPAILRDALEALAAEGASPRLVPGTRLGRYEILSTIGVGGMGEVYRARDTRLDRIIALKRLNANVAASPEGCQQFESEARATSALNHPHICTLHDVGEHDDVHFLVMELVEGETLAARLQRGALPMTNALQCAAQMADALAAAHRQGIVHRDLKPANVMLTAHGVKLLDFGLAALRRLPRRPDGGERAEAGTAEGVIVGTLQYMAPEQIQGRPVDERADVFALGAILYEMLAGRKAFAADSPAAVRAAVLDQNPSSLTGERPDVPPVLDWTVAQCLIKVAEERWQSAADLARQLQWIDGSRNVVDRPPASPWAPGQAIAWLAAATVVAGLAAGLISDFRTARQQTSTPLPYRFEIHAPAGTSYEPLFAISPDGRRLAFTTTDAAGLRSLWIRPLEGLAAQRIESADGASNPFWSPDGKSVGFFADYQLKIVDLGTGTVRVLSATGIGGGGTWNADDVILFADESTATAPSSRRGLRRVSASGGVATPVMRFEQEGAGIQAYPHFLPDGRHYLFMHLPLTGEAGVYAGRLDDGQPRRILPATVTVVAPRQIDVHGPLRATYAAGYLFYLDSSNGALMAQSFDVARLELTGDAMRLADHVESSMPGRSAYDASATGALVYRASAAASGGANRYTWFERASREGSRFESPGPYRNPALATARTVGAPASRDGRSERFLTPAPIKSPAPAPIVVLTNWPSLVKP